jgi:molecular chaperone GrpE (heat shock protein)
LLDHVFVLHQSAVASKRTDVIDQLAQFQNACREVTRRVGLAPFAAAPGEVFDAERHAVPGAEPAPAGAPIADTLATGYTYQGRLLRPALVKLEMAAPTEGGAPVTDAEPSLL